jgi:hypothetical protein
LKASTSHLAIPRSCGRPDNPLDLVERVVLSIDRQLRRVLREIDRIYDRLYL